MQNIKLILSYDGTDYCGWEKQPNVFTVSGTLEKAVKRLVPQEDTKIIAASRTDAGVHAKGQVVNFFTNCNIPIQSLPKAINNHLPVDIVVYNAESVEDTFHARFSAKYRKYCYSILNTPYPSVFYRNYSHWIPYTLNIEKMNEAGKYLIGVHDFSPFASKIKVIKNTIRNLQELTVVHDNPFIYCYFTANAFLPKMIRSIVSTLLKVGSGRIEASTVKEILSTKDRTRISTIAPPHGLCLLEVGYS